MYVATVPNRGSRPAVLLREGYRQDGKVRNRTLANLTHWPADQVDSLRRLLRGETLASVDDVFEIVEEGSRAHGHVEAVRLTMKRLGFEELIASRPSRERDLVVALVVARILKPRSKLATSRWWNETTLPEILGVTDADENELYAAMDWLLERQSLIEKKLAARHLENDGVVLYDLTSSYFEGATCPLAALGHNRDGKTGKLQVNYGLLTNQRGIPISVSVFDGNTGDPKTLLPQVDKVKNEFGIERFVLVGDRGMITQKQISQLRDMDGVDWIAALRPEAIKKLVNSDAIQMGFFDERNLYEVTHPDFPGERLVACKNPELAKKRAHKRQSLLEATATELEKVRLMAGRGRLHGKEQIGEAVSKVLNKYKVGESYTVAVRDDGFEASLDEDKVAESAARDARHRLGKTSTETRRRHIEVIAAALEKVRQRIDCGQLHGKAAIGVRVGKVINKYKVGKHFKLDIRDDGFDFEIDQHKVAEEAALDGIYVVRTSLPRNRLDADDTVRSYKLLSQVERAFRSFKTVDLKVRPIHHHLEDRVRAHILLCMLAYYVQWHMLEAWRPLLFSDEDQDAKAKRDPVAPAKRSDAALRKVHTKRLDDGTEAHSFETLIGLLSKIVRNRCRRRNAAPDVPTFYMDTTPSPKQHKAYDLLKTIHL